MLMSFTERVHLGGLLPIRGRLADMRLRKAFLEKIQLTQEEVEKYHVRRDEATRMTLWDKDAPTIEVDIKDHERVWLRNVINEADRQGLIMPDALDICERILGD